MYMSYYEILDIADDADADEIRKSYKKMALNFHPDKTGGDDAKFKEVLEAYTVLSNDDKRSEYDATYHMQRQTNMQPFYYPPEIAVEITLEEAMMGATRDVQLVVLTFRNRDGKQVKPAITRCVCRSFLTATKCLICQNSGHIIRNDVKVERAKKMHTIHIEPGTLRMTVENNVINLFIQPHPKFTILGGNLKVKVQISIYQAVIGGHLVIPYFGGKTLSVKHGPQLHEGVYRIPYKGLQCGLCIRGDLLVAVTHYLPSNMSPEEQARFREMYKAFFIAPPPDSEHVEHVTLHHA